MGHFTITLTQIGIFLILIVIGVITVKTKILDEHALGRISGFVIRVALPLYIFLNAVEGATRETLLGSLIVVPISVIAYLLLILVSGVIEKIFHLQGNRKKVYRACFIFSNIGFMGIPLVMVIYPDTALLYVSVYTIVDQLVMWTYGITLTKPVSEEKSAFSLKLLKNIFSPPLVAIILAVIFVLLDIPLPGVLVSGLTAVGNTSMPLALIYIGGMICTINIKPVLKSAELYVGFAVKMILIPILFYAVLRALGLADDLAGTVAFIIALPGIELVPMMVKENGSDGDYALCAIMLGTIVSLITLPVVSLCITMIG